MQVRLTSLERPFSRNAVSWELRAHRTRLTADLSGCLSPDAVASVQRSGDVFSWKGSGHVQSDGVSGFSGDFEFNGIDGDKHGRTSDSEKNHGQEVV